MLARVTVLGILRIAVWTQANSDTVTTNRSRTGLDYFQRKSRPILYRSTIFVRTVVDIVMKKLLKEVPIGSFNKPVSIFSQKIHCLRTMYFDAIKASFDGILRCFSVIGCHLMDLFNGHGNRRVICPQCPVSRPSRYRNVT